MHSRVACLALALAFASISARAQVSTIWQIGQFNGSSTEFRDSFGVDYSGASSSLDFTIGNNTDNDWLRFQPGNANGLAGAREHPFRIHFNLATFPRDNYTLRVAILYETPRLSTLQLNVNGHSGLFYFHPKLDYTAGDWEGTFVPQTSRDAKDISIPAAWLRQGENTFTLTALDSPSIPQSSLGDIAPGISGIVYDALALIDNGPRAASQTSRLSYAASTVFFRNAASGLAEVVQACVQTAPGAPPPSLMSLTSAGKTLSEPVPPSTEFGEACSSFSVPAWRGELAATLHFGSSTFPLQLPTQKQWTVHIVPGEHLDVGFTDYRARVAELQSQGLDGVIALLPKHPEFRWTMDGSWVAQQYLAGRSPQRNEALFNAIRDGHIVLPPEFANQHTGVSSLETLAHSLYYSHQLAREHNLPVGAAHITDVPSYSWSYASILHDAGVEYYAAGSNNWRAPILLLGRWNEKSPFYWEGPDGGRVLMWYSRAYLQLASLFGVPAQTAAVHDALPVFLQAYQRPDYYANSVLLFGSQLENTPLDPGQVALPSAWAEQYAYPRFDFSTFADAMADIEHQFGNNIPVVRGDFGPYWEDGFTSGAKATALARNDEQRILNAEKMGTLPALLNPGLRPDESMLNRAWQDLLLFDEHTWTSVGAATRPESDQTIGQWNLKQDGPVDAASNIEQSIQRSWAQLTSFLAPRYASVAVFNTLSWPRGGWVEADLSPGEQVLDPSTHRPLPQQVLRVEPGVSIPGFGTGVARVRFQAADIPSFGYKLFAIAQGKTPSPAPTVSATQTVLENRFYRITLDPASGSIASIWDKDLNRELVDTHSPYRFGAYIYVTGADDVPRNSLYRYGGAQSLPALIPHTGSAGRILSVTSEAGLVTAVLSSSAPNTPSIRTEITLPSDEKRIDLRYEIHKVATLRKEAAYFAFPFAIDAPHFAYDTQNAFVDPLRDELPGGSREWYAAQHWAAVHNDAVSAAVLPIDAPMITFGDIVRGAWPADFKPASSTIFSWIMSNYWNTNFPAQQGGDVVFRYVILSSPVFDAAKLARAGREALTPLESSSVPSTIPSPAPVATVSATSLGNNASFLSLKTSDVAVSTWKLAEDGDGSILRLEEIAGHPTHLQLHLPYFDITQAWQCSILEDRERELAVSKGDLPLDIGPWQILTLRLHTRPGAPLAAAQGVAP
jgi:alpha-mannosidase